VRIFNKNKKEVNLLKDCQGLVEFLEDHKKLASTKKVFAVRLLNLLTK